MGHRFRQPKGMLWTVGGDPEVTDPKSYFQTTTGITSAATISMRKQQPGTLAPIRPAGTHSFAPGAGRHMRSEVGALVFGNSFGALEGEDFELRNLELQLLRERELTEQSQTRLRARNAVRSRASTIQLC